MFGARRQQAPADGPFYKQRGWLNAAGFLAFLVTMSLVAFAMDDGEAPESSTAPGREALAGISGPLSPGDPQQARRSPGGRPDTCRTDDRDTAQPVAAPTDVRWKKLATDMVPISTSAGPLRTDTGTWWCFAHTPLGAVLAAHVIPVQMEGAAWRTVAEQQIVPGEARDRLVEMKISADEAESENGAIERFTGFSVASYSENSAVISLLVVTPLGGNLSMSVSVRWREGDWKVEPQDDGSLYSSAKTATPNNFVLWEG
ncbi:hypothetical protein [Streptomyces sp. NPDC049744]|uniref:hypothetical protein n=1 Tax=Streptomyces sp. NPDC049744 TaxID=3154359 RepID=UPI0034271A19